MSVAKSKSELEAHKKQAVAAINNYLSDLLDSDDTIMNGKADKLCYWIETWCKYLKHEERFKPASLKRYKRGEIVKVNLGFNVGSEEGGLHYAVVIDDNSIKNPVIHVVPLTSVKKDKDLNNLPSGSIYIGNDLFTSLTANLSAQKRKAEDALEMFLAVQSPDDDALGKISKLRAELELLKRMQTEIQKMKKGSIALVGQITTISKIRILDPKTNHDVLSHIKLSNEKLDMIDDEIRKLYTSSKQKIIDSNQ